MLDTIDAVSPGGHAVVDFHDVRVPRSAVLGEIGQGFRNAQVRLGPARLTHCMRWLGAARRAHDVAVDYARRRHAFGRLIGEHEGIGFMLADNEMDLQHCRLAVWHAAWLLDQGQHARTETSQCKVFCSEALSRVVDRSLQVLGGLGITTDTVVQRIYREIRPFRIYDGPSEVHRYALARRIVGAAAEGSSGPRKERNHADHTSRDLRRDLPRLSLAPARAHEHRDAGLRSPCRAAPTAYRAAARTRRRQRRDVQLWHRAAPGQSMRSHSSSRLCACSAATA